MVDREVFRTQGNLIKDSLNIMWADRETRSPHHPLRDLNMLMWYNVNTGLWDFRDDVLDAVYDNGSFPSRGYGPRRAVVTDPDVAASAIATKANGAINDAASIELGGDFIIGTTLSFTATTDIGAENFSLVYDRAMSAESAAESYRWYGNQVSLLKFDSYGSKIMITPLAPENTAVISNLTIV